MTNAVNLASLAVSGALSADSSGLVGIGTTSPTERLQVAGSIRVTTNAYNFNVLGGQFDFASNATRVSAYNSTGGVIQFFTNASGGTVNERVRIDDNGSLLVGTTSVGDHKVIVSSTSQWALGLAPSPYPANGNAYSFIVFRKDTSSGTAVGSITSAGTTTAYNTSSDYRLKENVQPMQNALAKVTALKPCTYTWKSDGSAGEGFIAHELAEVVPDAVTGEKDAVNEDGSIKPQGIDTSFLVATLTAAIQELKAEVDQLRAQLEAK